MTSAEKQVCEKCGRSKTVDAFFSYKDGTKDTICKQCLLEHVDNGDESTFMWILERYDVPFVRRKWVRESNREYIKNPGQFGPMSVMGKYLRTMKMQQFISCGFADSDELNKDTTPPTDEEQELELKKQLTDGTISQAQYDTLSSTTASESRDGQRQLYVSAADRERAMQASLTPEDRLYLMTKWGTAYSAVELIRMEDMYRRYEAEYEMNVDREETLKKLCRTSVKMDAALDSDNTLDYKSLSQVFDSLRKTGRFTEQQNKEDRTDVVDSVGQLVLLCERDGGIIDQFPDPEDYPQDKIDLTISNFKQYSVDLLRNEPNVAGLIETYITKLEQAKEKTERYIETGTMAVPGEDDEIKGEDEDEVLTDEEMRELQSVLNGDYADPRGEDDD